MLNLGGTTGRRQVRYLIFILKLNKNISARLKNSFFRYKAQMVLFVINIKWNKILMLYICRSGDIEEYKRKYEEELEKWKQELEKVEKDAAKDKIEKNRLEKETKHVR